jgi:hypothetical protein
MSVVARFEFECVGARGELYAVTPTMALTIRVAETSGTAVHALALRCQVWIEPQRRRYTAAEAERLTDLFGDPPRWDQTLRPLHLSTVSSLMPGFTGAGEIDVPVPCGYDVEIASTRYFYALDDGTVALRLLYSGTAFLDHGSGFTVQQLPWSTESRYHLPVAVWREMIERDFPDSAWLRCGRNTLDALGRFKSRHALATWDQAIRTLLASEGGP